MKRMIRRQLRQWGRDFMSVWQRLTAFHRIVIGIIVAMVIVYVARMRVIDPLTEEVAGLSERLREAGAPITIPAIEHDQDLQQEQLRSENLLSSIAELEKLLAELEESAGIGRLGGMADAHAELLAIASRSRVRVRAKGSVTENRSESERVLGSSYELSGSFPAIYAFLEGLRAAPLLWEIRAVELKLARPVDGHSTLEDEFGSPELNLTFQLLIHRRGGGGS